MLETTIIQQSICNAKKKQNIEKYSSKQREPERQKSSRLGGMSFGVADCSGFLQKRQKCLMNI